jgi:deoxyribose-phosphate aldolase
MEIIDLLKKYPIAFDDNFVAKNVIDAKSLAKEIYSPDNLKLAFSTIDLTTLNATDSKEKGKEFANKVNNFHSIYEGIPDVAAICVYPTLIKPVATYLKIKTVGLASVGAGFPSSQTFLDVKLLECKMAALSGATDIDVVISLGTWFDGNYEEVYNEIKAIKKAIGNSHLKVILETGVLTTVEHIWNASIVAMEAGAEFIKTSTGKANISATPEAVFVMCKAVESYKKQTGKAVGIKVAGGISTSEDALMYLAIVKMVLGEEWLNKKRFRIGASRLANNLVSDIIKLETGVEDKVKYF